MENEERHASYAAVAGSKSTTLSNVEPVLDSWEEAAQDGIRSQELERNIEEKLDKMKQKQIAMQPNDSNTSSNHGIQDAVTGVVTGESRSSVDLTATSSSSGPMIRILKRPQSSGHLPNQGHLRQTGQSGQSKPAVLNAATSHNGRVPTSGNVGRNNQQQQQQQRTLEERAAAYAEARMRIFGVADQQIHDDLPVQPNLSMLSRSNQSSPGPSSTR